MKDFKEIEIAQLALDYYGLEVEARRLNGYDELNFLLSDRRGSQYIMKIAGDEHGLAFLDAQIRILEHLGQSEVKDKFQHCLNNSSGTALTSIIIDNRNYYLRVLTYLEGIFWVNQTSKPSGLYIDLGAFLGKMDKALQFFSHPAVHRHYVWDISQAADANSKLSYIRNHEQRRIASYFLLQFETEVRPQLSSLRHACVHHDANDYNILVNEDRVCGLIDFGDMVYTALINNVAVACTYAMLHHHDPLEAASGVVQGYHQQYPLTEEELGLLYYLIAARLCISVTQSAFHAALHSDNEHHFITEQPAWDLLYKLIRINPISAVKKFRKACGWPIPAEQDYAALLEDRKRLIGKNLSISYQKKLKIVKGAFQYLYDDQGSTYVDCVNNPSHVGHCHPYVVRKMQKQIATLNTNTRYLHDSMVEYARRLTNTLPSSLKVCYFVNSGSEANDLAVRISRHYTGNKDIIVLDHAYHGTSTLAMEMSPYKFDGKGGPGKMPWIHKAISPDLYRGPYKYNDPDAGRKYAKDVERIIEELGNEQRAPAVFICETLLGVGGQMPLPNGYLKEVYRSVREVGGLCIADEVQVGFGRVGDAFWGFELQQVEPDIVVLGKPIGNGHPLAAVVVSADIANSFNNGMEYFNTYGGNPVSMETGLAVLDVIQQEEMQKHAQEVGAYLMSGLRNLMKKHPIITDVRGHGLFIGAEMVKDAATLQPAVPEIDAVVEMVRNKGYLLSTDGPLHNVLKIKPPMTFTKQNADELIQYLDEALSVL